MSFGAASVSRHGRCRSVGLSADSAARFADGIAPEIGELRRDDLDEHWHCTDAAGVVQARCSLWWRKAPQLNGLPTGVIGHYAAADSCCGRMLLDEVMRRFAATGCQRVIAPMNGNTWRNYRFITEQGTEPAFLFEPRHPQAWLEDFHATGFVPLAHYFSALNDDLDYEDAAVACAGRRLSAAGVRLRCLDRPRLDAELEIIYQVTRRSFCGNFLYTPISFPVFTRQYAEILNRIEPGLIWLAEMGGRCVGYVFMLPDLLQAQRGQPIDSAILKTVAVLPGRVHAGLGAWLVARSQIAARAAGFRRVIHALIHEGNFSGNISARFARPMRRYALLVKSV